MNVFLDANILVAIVKREAKRAEASARVLSLADHPRFKVYTTAISVATSFYFAGKRHGDEWAKRQLSILCDKLFIAPCDEAEIRLTLKEQAVHDLEDGFQYFAALRAGCDALITYSAGDFYFSKIPIFEPGDFLYQLAQFNTKK